MTEGQPEHTSTRKPRFVRWALVLGIIILLNVLFAVISALALPTPQMPAACGSPAAPPPQTAAACDHLGGTWTEYGAKANAPVATTTPGGYCDLSAVCQQPYQHALGTHGLYVFVLYIGLGLIAMLIGLAPLGTSVISDGLSYGGAIAFIIGSVSYWGSAGNWVRLGIVLVGLVALLYVAWRNFRD